MNDFEELAHRSADALRNDIADGPVPDFREPSRSGVLVLGVVVFLVAGISVALWMRNDTDAMVETNDDPDAGEVDGDGAAAADPVDFRLMWPAENYAIESIRSFPNDGPGSVAHTGLYGSGTAEVPYSDRDLLLATWVDSSGNGDAFSGEEILVRGGVGYRDQSLLEFGFPEAVAFYEGDDIAVVVASRTLDLEALIVVANGLTFDEHRARSPVSSLTPLAEIDGFATAPGFSISTPWHVGFSDDAYSRGIVVRGYSASPDALLLERYIHGAGDSTPVRGTEGWLLPGREGDLPGTSSLIWYENGNVVTLVGVGLDPVGVAGELVTVDRPRWQAMVTEFEESDSLGTRGQTGAGVVVVEGRALVAGGALSWTVLLEPGSSVCLRFDGDPGASTGCSGHGLAVRIIDDEIALLNPAAFGVAGTAAPEVSRMTLEWPDGRVEQLTLADSSTIARQVFGGVAESSGDVDLVAYDDAGTELARQNFPSTPDP